MDVVSVLNYLVAMNGRFSSHRFACSHNGVPGIHAVEGRDTETTLNETVAALSVLKNTS